MYNIEVIKSHQPDAVVREFRSLAEWNDFAASHVLSDVETRRQAVERARQQGVRGVHTGYVTKPDIVQHRDGNHWTIFANGLDMHNRAVLDIIASAGLGPSARIFAGEAKSRLALDLRGRYPQFLGSQYMPDPEVQRALYPIPHQDLMALTLPDDCFDVTVSIEVMEHLHDLRAALAEQARVLRSGGTMLATFPFAWTSPSTIRKAELRDGQVVHLVETPEYHGDSMTAEGILVFQIPGWDVLDLAKEVGFSDASIVYYSSVDGGILGHDLMGWFVFMARK